MLISYRNRLILNFCF